MESRTKPDVWKTYSQTTGSSSSKTEGEHILSTMRISESATESTEPLCMVRIRKRIFLQLEYCISETLQMLLTTRCCLYRIKTWLAPNKLSLTCLWSAGWHSQMWITWVNSKSSCLFLLCSCYFRHFLSLKSRADRPVMLFKESLPSEI